MARCDVRLYLQFRLCLFPALQCDAADRHTDDLTALRHNHYMICTYELFNSKLASCILAQLIEHQQCY